MIGDRQKRFPKTSWRSNRDVDDCGIKQATFSVDKREAGEQTPKRQLAVNKTAAPPQAT